LSAGQQGAEEQMASRTVVRDATESDVGRLTGIYAHWVKTGTMSFELEAPDEAEMLVRFRAVKRAGYPYLVMEEGGVIVGYAYAGAYRPRPAYRFTAENSIYLAKDAGGRGLGSILLQALLKRLKSDGYRSVIGIVSDPEVNASSVALHAKAGFREFGRAEGIGFKFDRWIDVAYLQLKF
jgi:L-amino acid N-acyltransferase YncA